MASIEVGRLTAAFEGVANVRMRRGVLALLEIISR
jgi:hypothetical protein